MLSLVAKAIVITPLVAVAVHIGNGNDPMDIPDNVQSWLDKHPEVVAAAAGAAENAVEAIEQEVERVEEGLEGHIDSIQSFFGLATEEKGGGLDSGEGYFDHETPMTCENGAVACVPDPEDEGCLYGVDEVVFDEDRERSFVCAPELQ